MCELCKHLDTNKMTLSNFQQRCLETAGFATEEKINVVREALWDVRSTTNDEIEFDKLSSGIDALDETIYNDELNHRILGIVGEAGELAEKWKKVIRNQQYQFATVFEQKENPKLITREDLAAEAMDVMWYIATTLHLLGFELDEQANKLLDKLADRKARNVIKSSGDNR